MRPPAGKDSVDDGEVRWENNTTYDTPLIDAARGWDALGLINVEEDGLTVVEDVEVDDVRKDVCHGTLAAASTNKDEPAVWQPSGSADRIVLFKCFMDNYGPARQTEVIAHEFGHALGLEDIMDNTPQPGQLMMKGWCNCTTPQGHDKTEYEVRWGGGDAFDAPQAHEDFRGLCHITAFPSSVQIPILCD